MTSGRTGTARVTAGGWLAALRVVALTAALGLMSVALPGRPERAKAATLQGIPGDRYGQRLSLWSHRHYWHLASPGHDPHRLMNATFIRRNLMNVAFIAAPRRM